MPLLEVRRLPKAFKLHLSRGREIVGSGKSAVLKCIYRTCRASAGSILFETATRERVDLSREPPEGILALRKVEIGHVIQFLNVVPLVSAFDIVAQAVPYSGVPPDAGVQLLRERQENGASMIRVIPGCDAAADR